MLSKLIPKNMMLQRAAKTFMGATATRGVYTDETRPYVFINEHTKVIVQGMTGKHVSLTCSRRQKIAKEVAVQPPPRTCVFCHI